MEKKAVLILNKMPDCCWNCCLCDDDVYCIPSGKIIGLEFEDDGRPDWCPLIEIRDEDMMVSREEIEMVNEFRRSFEVEEDDDNKRA